jgi:hypothetical protein
MDDQVLIHIRSEADSLDPSSVYSSTWRYPHRVFVEPMGGSPFSVRCTGTGPDAAAGPDRAASIPISEWRPREETICQE